MGCVSTSVCVCVCVPCVLSVLTLCGAEIIGLGLESGGSLAKVRWAGLDGGGEDMTAQQEEDDDAVESTSRAVVGWRSI